MKRYRCWSRLALLLAVAAPREARSDGAFPDSMQILLPADRPGEIVLATNFGLISTDDGGHTWQWSCEAPALTSASLYQVGPSPLDRVFAVSDSGIVSSDDQACSWLVASGPGVRTTFSDLFSIRTARPMSLASGVPRAE